MPVKIVKKRLRTFIAVDLTATVKQTMTGIFTELLKTGADVKWVDPGSYHLTLAFLGTTPVEKVSQIQSLLSEVAKIPSFSISLEGFKVVPNLQRPRILWVAITRGSDHLKTIADNINQKLPALGFQPEDREFSAHVTLARFRSPRGANAITKTLKAMTPLPILEQEVRELILFTSTLTANGPIYEKLFTCPLK